MVVDMMGNPKFVNDASRCVYENDEILVSHDFMSYPDDTKEAVMLVCMIKDGTNNSYGKLEQTPLT